MDTQWVILLKEMQVETNVQEGETLRIGETSNQYKDGRRENGFESGWFKVDNFRLELKELFPSGIKIEDYSQRNCNIEGVRGGLIVHAQNVQSDTMVHVYSVAGVQLVSRTLTSNHTFVPLSQGVYIVKIVSPDKNDRKNNVSKVVVK